MTLTRNILVAGVGGQGVISYSKWLTQQLLDEGLKVYSSVYKGGAQQMGTVYSQLRIVPKSFAQPLSCDIPPRSIDDLIVFEPHEGLRFLHQLRVGGKVYLNDNPVSFFSERLRGYKVDYDIDTVYDPYLKIIVVPRGGDVSQLKDSFQDYFKSQNLLRQLAVQLREHFGFGQDPGHSASSPEQSPDRTR